MVIETLKVQLNPSEVDRYIRCDTDIWTPVLEQCAGFAGKEVWWDLTGEVMIVVRWASREEWKSIDEGILEETERAFVTAFGRSVPFLEERAYFQGFHCEAPSGAPSNSSVTP